MFMANLSSVDPITMKPDHLMIRIFCLSNMIPYDQYVKDIDMSVVHNNASSVPNDTFMMIFDDMCESITPSMSNSSRNAVVENSLTLNMESLKEKVEDRLVKQDQSLQIVHMLCRPRPLYNDLNKVAIGYKNPLCLTRATQAQPALYNGHEILKDNHARAKVHNTKDTLEIVEITRKKINAKMTDPECVTHKVKIAPHDYSKENVLATFTPQKQLTLKQIYWSIDLMKLKSKALKERAKVFSVATKSELYVARFAEMHVANTSVEARCLALEAELATLRDKSHQEN
nr:hypothetical protein [Tanacetum cinerariifolium]